MTNTEKRLADRRMAGKSTAQGMMLLEHIYKGEKYLLFTAVNNTVHIIPDKKLKELIHQALAEERERVENILDKYYAYQREDGCYRFDPQCSRLIDIIRKDI